MLIYYFEFKKYLRPKLFVFTASIITLGVSHEDFEILKILSG